MTMMIEAMAGASSATGAGAASARMVVMITGRTSTEEAAPRARAAWGAITGTVVRIMAAPVSARIMERTSAATAEAITAKGAATRETTAARMTVAGTRGAVGPFAGDAPRARTFAAATS